MTIGAEDQIALKIGDDLVFGDADFDALEEAIDDLFADLGGAAHEDELFFGLHGALPIDQCCGIKELRVGQLCEKGLEGFGREVVIVHFDADADVFFSDRFDALGEVLHGVACGGLDEVVGVAVDVAVFHPDGADGAIGILAAAPPMRCAVMRDDYALMDIKRPAVIACEPSHV